jgi:hypothetical protein
MAFIALIDKLVPSYENPHEPHTAEQMQDKPPPPNSVSFTEWAL